MAVGQELHAAAAARGIEQAHAELPRSASSMNLVQLLRSRSPPAQVREHEQLEQLDRRVPPFGVAAGVGAMRGNRRGHQPARIPQLQLPGGEAVSAATSRELYVRFKRMVSSRHPRADVVQPHARRVERLERPLSTVDRRLSTADC